MNEIEWKSMAYFENYKLLMAEMKNNIMIGDIKLKRYLGAMLDLGNHKTEFILGKKY